MLPITSTSQINTSPPYGHGTLVIAMISKNTISIGADSRMAFDVQEGGNYLAYLDGINKIHFLNNFVITFCGNTTIDKFFVKQVIADFKTTKPTYTNAESLLLKFISFLEKKFPDYHKSLYSNTSFNMIMCAGYFNKKPQVVSFFHGKISDSPGFFVSRDNISASDVHLIRSSLETNAQQTAIRKVIKGYPLYGAPNDVGGPTQLIQLNSNGTYNKLTVESVYNWNFFIDFIDDYFAGKSEVTFLKPSVKSGFDSAMKDYYKLLTQ